MVARRLSACMVIALVVAGCTVAAAGGSSAPAPPMASAWSTSTASVAATATIAPTGSVAPPASADPTIAADPTTGVGPTASAAATPTARTAAGLVTVDLYRRGIYAMQATWWWCTAASVEMLRNIILGQTDHSAASQSRYFAYMRAHNSYVMPVREGVDLVGLRAGLRRFVDSRYTLVASASFDAAVRTAVTALRRSGRPVVLVVDGGHHVWLMTGFAATADPVLGPAFRVTSVRIVGPLYGRQSRDGYDPPPDTALSYGALRRFLLPYHFKFGPTPWDRRFVVYTS